MLTKTNFFIISGPPGSGKSTLLSALTNQGYITVSEAARDIIAEQRMIQGQGLYDRDRSLF